MKVYEKLRRIEQALKDAKSKGMNVSKEKLIANLMIEWSCYRRDVAELLKTLIIAGLAKDTFADEQKCIEWIGEESAKP